MSLSKDEVVHIAALARLSLTADEMAQYQNDLSAILDYMAALNALDTSAIPPTATVLPLEGIMRDDVVRPSLDRDVLLANGAETADGCFVVPAVLDNDEAG